jgi:site-specific DNA recombinase
MTDKDMRVIPPLVSNNRFDVLKDHRSTLHEEQVEVGGYIRISTRKDSQLTSIENQKKYLREWAEVNGYRLVRFYTDVKSGAYEYLRDEMKQLREDIRAGIVRGILSKEISRTSRDIMDILELKRSLAGQGAFFISIKENYDSRTDDDEFLLVIHAGLAQKERKTTGSRVKITQMIKAREGKTNVASPAYGYRLSKDRGRLEADPDTACIYRSITDRYLEGWGQLKICKWLNRQGIKAKRGGRWNTNSVKTLLTNPVYLGITIYNATTLVRDDSGKRKRMVRPEADWVIRYETHEPLISREKFERIQNMIRERRERDAKEWSCSKKYLLSGLLYCDVCKGKIFGSKTSRKRKKGRDYVFLAYVDQNRYGDCDTRSKYWNMEKVDRLVMNEVKSFFSDRSLIEERIRIKQHLYNRNAINEKTERERLAEKLGQLSAAVHKQQEAYENGILSIDEYRTRIAELRGRKNELLFKIDVLDKRLQKAGDMEERYRDIRDRVLKLIENIESLDRNTKEMLLKKLVRRIFIKADYTLKIQYMFDE